MTDTTTPASIFARHRGEILGRFATLSPTPAALATMKSTRTAFSALADQIILTSRPSREQSAALTALEEAKFWANQALALHGPFTPPTEAQEAQEEPQGVTLEAVSATTMGVTPVKDGNHVVTVLIPVAERSLAQFTRDVIDIALVTGTETVHVSANGVGKAVVDLLKAGLPVEIAIVEQHTGSKVAA